MEVLWRCCGRVRTLRTGVCPPPTGSSDTLFRPRRFSRRAAERAQGPAAGRTGRAGGRDSLPRRGPEAARRPAPSPPGGRRRLGGARVGPGALGRGCPVRRSERWREGWATECPPSQHDDDMGSTWGNETFRSFLVVLGYRSAKNSCRPRTATSVLFAPACRRRFLRPAASLPGPQTACQNQGCKSVAVCPTPRRRGAQKAGSSVHPARNDRIASIPSRGAAPRERSTGGGWGGTTFPHFKTRQTECQRSVSGG